MVNNKQKRLRKMKTRKRRKIKRKPKILPITLINLIPALPLDLQRNRIKIKHKKNMIIIKRRNPKKNNPPQQNRKLMKVQNKPKNLPRAPSQNPLTRQ